MDKNELLLEIVKTLPQPLNPDEVTATMVANAAGYSINGARQFLTREVQAGRLESHDAIENGKIVKAYRKVKK